MKGQGKRRGKEVVVMGKVKEGGRGKAGRERQMKGQVEEEGGGKGNRQGGGWVAGQVVGWLLTG